MWDLPGPGIESVSLALAGRFLTTVPPAKSPPTSFLFKILRLFLLIFYINFIMILSISIKSFAGILIEIV